MIRPFLTFTTILVLLVLASVARPQPQNVGPGRLRAGGHKVDFTPKASEQQTSTDSIRDHLFARAIVIDDGSTLRVNSVGIDSGAVPNQMLDDAIVRASKSTGCPSQNFLISATICTVPSSGSGAEALMAQTDADAIVEAGDRW